MVLCVVLYYCGQFFARYVQELPDSFKGSETSKFHREIKKKSENCFNLGGKNVGVRLSSTIKLIYRGEYTGENYTAV